VPSVVVAGASGYAGALAAALLQRHPRFDLAAVTSRSDVGMRLSDLYPYHRVHMDLEDLDVDRHGQADAAIVAYPHGAAAPVVAELRARDVRVVDLSADFRLRLLDVYEHWYVPHPHPELLSDAVYGLPELRRAQIEGADIVANPGCYPTATLLALAPLAPWLQDVVVDAKSGISGAGRAPTAKTHFVAADENVTPYGVAGHRHAPEIDQELAMLGAPITTTFVPHLMPLDQGELVSCYCTLREPVDIEALYRRAYAREPFVELTEQPPGVRDVRDTNYCRIHARFDERTQKAFVFAAIDNLWKGASSQAVQNLNLMFGYDETVGLL
jgi:N-acetyl-gamma-glutamyl-phosphate reductase